MIFTSEVLLYYTSQYFTFWTYLIILIIFQESSVQVEHLTRDISKLTEVQKLAYVSKLLGCLIFISIFIFVFYYLISDFKEWWKYGPFYMRIIL